MQNATKTHAKRIITEIIRQSPGDRLEGKVRLFKAFYLAHLFYAGENADYLTEWPIVRMPNGPGIDRFDELMEELKAASLIEEESTKIGPFNAKCFRFSSQQTERLPAAEESAVRRAVEFIDGMTGSQLSDITHEYSKSWRDTQDGSELNIYLDLLDETEYEKVQSERRETESAFKEAWV
ncbi:type II toxin-antitoxin system antitoxin SocA domain-containing protein [Rhodopirellula bahusiensis]|uniref:type II toxin-antitoxin system antitoxin SocA domain-containing protein n=1 Tax=Rhodopirellula bahusiensis TaxID=2014065 RepID=UPI00326522EF